jgi:hypothetical protein
VALARRIGAGHEEARAALALARHLLNAGQPPSRARPHLRRASSIFARMGAHLELTEAAHLMVRAAA